MNSSERWKIVSILLSYPDAAFLCTLGEILEYVQDAGDEGLVRVVRALSTTAPEELVCRYVQSFDFQESTALYLTAHELGDSRERGGALLELHAMLRSAGLVLSEGELPDYLPVLFEFLAEKPIGMPTTSLEARLDAVCEGIAGRLETDSPYRPLFREAAASLRESVQREDTKDTTADSGDRTGLAGPGTPEESGWRLSTSGMPVQSPDGNARVEASDADDLPYPLVYD